MALDWHDETPGYLAASSVAQLCEPMDSRRPYPTKDERKVTIQLIEDTCDALGVGDSSCVYFSKIVSLRESSYRWWVRHKLEQDHAAAASAYLRVAHNYGWSVRWTKKHRKAEDLSAIEAMPREGFMQNLYFVEVERWLTGGLGLGGLNVANHLGKFDALAPPEVLCDPVVNVLVQVTIARNAVDRYGAQNFYEVQAVYAGRTYSDEDGHRKPLSCAAGCPKGITYEQRQRAKDGDARLAKRCEAKGLDCLAHPDFGQVLRGHTKVSDRYELVESVRGRPLPAYDEPVPTVTLIDVP